MSTVITNAERLSIDNMKFFLMLLVVILHTTAATYPYLHAPDQSYGLMLHYLNTLTLIAVPGFFFISGYLFHGEESLTFKAYTGKLKSRFRTLLIPYVVWNIIVLMVFFLVQSFFPVASSMKKITDYTVVDFLRVFIDISDGYPINYPLWFIRDLLLIVIISPALMAVLRYVNWCVLLSVYVILHLINTPPKSSLFYSL